MDHKELEKILRGMGAYEEGMHIDEMRQLFNALQLSANEDHDVRQSVRASQMDVLPSSSRMMSTRPSTSTGRSPLNPTRRTTKALVHHEMCYSPPREPLQDTRRSVSDNTLVDISSDSTSTSSATEPTVINIRQIRNNLAAANAARDIEQSMQEQRLDVALGAIPRHRTRDRSLNRSRERRMPSASDELNDSSISDSPVEEPLNGSTRARRFKLPNSVRIIKQKLKTLYLNSRK